MSPPILPSPLEENVVIVGVGLIGGSLALAMKHYNVARKVIGVGRNQTRLEVASRAGLIDECSTDIASVIDRADLIVICTPVDRVVSDVLDAEAARSKSPGKSLDSFRPLMTDVGSVKGPICDRLKSVTRFIGSHPIAGSHQQGFEAANAHLFEGRTCVLTPLASTAPNQLKRLERFWNAVGMHTVQMSPVEHDQSLAMTSHLPHLIAAALAMTLSDQNRSLTGSGFRDTTRVAAGDPELWAGILSNNAKHLLDGIDEFQCRLDSFREALASGNPGSIRDLLADGQRSRLSLDQNQQGLDQDHSQ